MASKTKRDALEVLICERLQQEIERLARMETATSVRLAGKQDGLQHAIRTVRESFEECR